MNDSTLTKDIAEQYIEEGRDLLYVTAVEKSYFLVATKFNRDFTDRCHVVPSWLWIRDRSAYKVHYLDLPTLEAIAYKGGYTVRYSPESIPVMKDLRELYLGRRKIKTCKMFDVPAKRELRPYQTVGAWFMYESKFVLNADGMGNGKTAQAAAAVNLNKSNFRPYKSIVVCPASVKFAWQKEFSIVTNLKTLVLDSKGEKRAEQYDTINDYEVLIMTYDSFLADYAILAKEFSPDILIIDECHRLSTRTNKITQVLIGGQKIKKSFRSMTNLSGVYLLTGTPISNRLEDLYAILKLLDPGLFTWNGFANRYTIEEQRRGRFNQFYTIITGYKNEKELKAKLSLHMVRRTKDEALPDLPPKAFKTIEVALDDEERKIYTDLKKEFKTKIRGKKMTVKDQLSWLTRAQQICNSLETLPEIEIKKSSKLAKLMQIIDKLSKEHKIVIFSKFKSMTTIINRECAHLNPLHLNGTVKDTKRWEMIEAFQTKDKHRVFVSTLGAGGVGITLTAADVVILYDRWWAPYLNFQAVDRLHRLGQTKPVTAISLRVRDSVEEHIEKVWLKKQKLVESMVGDEAVLKELTKGELEDLI